MGELLFPWPLYKSQQDASLCFTGTKGPSNKLTVFYPINTFQEVSVGYLIQAGENRNLESRKIKCFPPLTPTLICVDERNIAAPQFSFHHLLYAVKPSVTSHYRGKTQMWNF